MAILSPTFFTPTLPSLFFALTPSSPYIWFPRFTLFFLTITFSLPLITILGPLSVLLPPSSAPLPLHPHNLPPYKSTIASIRRAIVIYTTGAIIWSFTGLGNAPEKHEGMSRWMTRTALRLAEYVAEKSEGESKLAVEEVVIPPIEESECISVLGLPGLDRRPIPGFWLRHLSSTPRRKRPSEVPKKKVILFLAGGGYVTGWPLVHPVIFSLLRALPAVPNEKNVDYSLFAPDVRKSLDRERSFPIPVLDALAGWVHLRRQGWEAGDIIVLGDSAGAGLAWSLSCYLSILEITGEEKGKAWGGVPRDLVMISPWLSLPPIRSSPYPDWINEFAAITAARCYLARFPVVKHRPDPFSSDVGLWLEAVSRLGKSTAQHVLRFFQEDEAGSSRLKDYSSEMTDEMEDDLLNPDDEDLDDNIPITDWLGEKSFARLSSHHPFISPATDLSTPFVNEIIRRLKQNGTRFFVHSGTAEWFHPATDDFVSALDKEGVDVEYMEEKGAYHVETCVFPAELGGMSGRLVKGLVKWLL